MLGSSCFFICQILSRSSKNSKSSFHFLFPIESRNPLHNCEAQFKEGCYTERFFYLVSVLCCKISLKSSVFDIRHLFLGICLLGVDFNVSENEYFVSKYYNFILVSKYFTLYGFQYFIRPRRLDKSSHLHIRQKRVINLDNYEALQSGIGSAPYIVNIQKDNIIECAGSILSAVFVLATEYCVERPFFGNLRRYTILSGSEIRDSGTPHTIERRIVVEPHPALVLLKVSPNFDFNKSPNKPISLFLGAVPDPAYGTFSGWGCMQPGNISHTRVYPKRLMQTRLHIIPLAECRRIYRLRFPISNERLCTLDTTKRRGTCLGDLGGPLVLRLPPLYVHELIGVMSELRGEKLGEHPDVFYNLNHQVVNQWITHVIHNHAFY